MGFQFRRRSKGGTNLSVSSRGVRLSQTFKFGGVSFNVGRYFNGSQQGTVDSRATVNFGNGLRYQKNKTLHRDTNPDLTRHFEQQIDGNEHEEANFLEGLFASPLGAILYLCTIWVITPLLAYNISWFYQNPPVNLAYVIIVHVLFAMGMIRVTNKGLTLEWGNPFMGFLLITLALNVYLGWFFISLMIG